MRVAGAVGMAVAGTGGGAAHLEQRNGARRVDMKGAAALQLGTTGACEQRVEPEVEVGAHAHHQCGVGETLDIARARLVVLDIGFGRCQVRGRDAVAADRLDQAAQVAGGRDDAQSILRPGRGGCDQTDNENQRADEARDAPYFGALHSDLGIRQCTFFALALTMPTRQSIAPLARP